MTPVHSTPLNPKSGFLRIRPESTPTPEIVQDEETGSWYIPGHDHDAAWFVDDPKTLFIENVWMRPVPPPPIEERFDCQPLPLLRDERGRFKRVVWWEACGENALGAVPYIEVGHR